MYLKILIIIITKLEILLYVKYGSKKKMILNDFLGGSDRIKILETFLDNEEYSLTLDDVKRISAVSNPLNDLTILVNIGILSEQNREYKLNLKDKRVIFLSLIDNEEYSRKINEMDENGIFNEVKTFSPDIKNYKKK